MSNIDVAAMLQRVRATAEYQEKIATIATPGIAVYPSTSESARLLHSLVGQVPGHQERPAQLEMATLIEYALQQERHAVIEAATGTGKGKAYGVPAVLSGKKIVVSTANKALQAQLVEKDMPWINDHIQPFTFAVMKGESNYLCLDRLEKVGEEEAGDPVEDEAYQRLKAMTADATFNGDFENKALAFIPTRLKSKVNRDGDMCAGKKCNFYEQCYYYRMRAEAEAAQVVVTNHSLLAIDAAKDGKLLPSHEIVMLDEAHHLEEAATEAFTIKVAATRVKSLLALKLLQAHTAQKRRDAIEGQALLTWQELEKRFISAQQRTVLQVPVQEGLHLASMLQALAEAFEADKPDLSKQPKDDRLYDKLVKRVHNLAQDVRRVFAVKGDGYVHCMERVGEGRKQHIEVSRTPLDVAPLLASALFNKYTVVCTSATLATGENKKDAFTYFKSRVGLDGKLVEQVLPTVFDYKHNALLYIPRDVPVPVYTYEQREAYERAIIERMVQLVQASRGRAFLLFCSNEMKRKAYTHFLSLSLPYPLLCQEDGLSRETLTRQFCSAGNAVLFGVKTFWEGIDIPGDALSLVVIDKLPFNSPDPIHQARKSQLQDSFSTYDIPQVILSLKQGVGRLIRTDVDRGVMAILDVRIHIKSYGKHLIEALPPARRSESIQDVERFFREEQSA